MKVLVSLKYIIFLLTIFSCTKDGVEDINLVQNKDIVVPEKYSALENVQAYSVPDSFPYEISLTKVQEYGDSEDFFLSGSRSAGGMNSISSFLRFAVGGNGTVFLANNNQIEAFDTPGNHLKTLGREGRGPGEFSNFHPLFTRVSSNLVYAYDEGLKRVNIFNADSLDFSHVFPIDLRGISNYLDIPSLHVFFNEEDLFMISDSLALIGVRVPYQKAEHGGMKSYFIIDQEGDVVSESMISFREHPNNSLVLLIFGKKLDYITMPFPSDSYMKIAFDRNFNIYSSEGEEFLIKVYNSEGKYQRSIYYEFDNSEFKKEEIFEYDKYNSAKKERAQNYDFPKVWPAVNKLFVDDKERIWVSTITDDEEHFEWWILKNNGVLMAKFQWPGKRMERNPIAGDVSIPIVKNGFFYISELDKATNLNKVVKYKIILEKKD